MAINNLLLLLDVYYHLYTLKIFMVYFDCFRLSIGIHEHFTYLRLQLVIIIILPSFLQVLTLLSEYKRTAVAGVCKN